MEKQAKKNLIIRLIVYPIVILSAIFLYRFIWFNYTGEYIENSITWHTFKMKLRGVEFCETPEEAIQRYADALIKGDRDKALGYVYKPKYDTEGWVGEKKYLYSRTDEELNKEGTELLKGWADNRGGGVDWRVRIITEEGKEENPFMLRIVNLGSDGWKIK